MLCRTASSYDSAALLKPSGASPVPALIAQPLLARRTLRPPERNPAGDPSGRLQSAGCRAPRRRSVDCHRYDRAHGPAPARRRHVPAGRAGARPRVLRRRARHPRDAGPRGRSARARLGVVRDRRRRGRAALHPVGARAGPGAHPSHVPGGPRDRPDRRHPRRARPRRDERRNGDPGPRAGLRPRPLRQPGGAGRDHRWTRERRATSLPAGSPPGSRRSVGPSPPGPPIGGALVPIVGSTRLHAATGRTPPTCSWRVGPSPGAERRRHRVVRQCVPRGPHADVSSLRPGTPSVALLATPTTIVIAGGTALERRRSITRPTPPTRDAFADLGQPLRRRPGVDPDRRRGVGGGLRNRVRQSDSGAALGCGSTVAHLQGDSHAENRRHRRRGNRAGWSRRPGGREPTRYGRRRRDRRLRRRGLRPRREGLRPPTRSAGRHRPRRRGRRRRGHHRLRAARQRVREARARPRVRGPRRGGRVRLHRPGDRVRVRG